MTPRLPFLTGARGAACLFVMLGHLVWEWVEGGSRPGLPAWTGWILGPLDHHHFGVTIFLAISGFSLALPVAQTGEVRGGWRAFWIRRARRILPPYYAALLFSLAVIAAVPGMGTLRDSRWDHALPVDSGAVLTHVLLLHNLSPAWLLKIDPPMWSIATEAQLYAFFPLFAGLAGRRSRPWALLGLGLALAAILVRVWPTADAAPQLAGAFAAGVAVPFLPVRPRELAEAGAVGAVLVVGYFCLFPVTPIDYPTMDVLVGIVVALLLGGMEEPILSAFRRALESRPALWLGERSYSLYLFHFPVFSLVRLGLDRSGVTGPATLGGLALVALPAALAVGELAYRLVERPSMRWGVRSATM